MGSTVFADLNDNGVYEPLLSEVVVSGISVSLIQQGSIISSTVTNSTGNYLFSAVYPGNYR